MTKLLQWAAVVTMLYAAAVTTPAISKAAADGQCADVEVIFARGTLEPPGPGAPSGKNSPMRSTAVWAAARSMFTGSNYPASLELRAGR